MAWTSWTGDLRQALRTLRRSLGFTATAVGMLGLAIGAAAGMYSVVDGVLLEPLPYADTDRLVHIAASAPGSELEDEFGVSAEFYIQYAERSRLLEDLSTFNSFTNTLRHGDRVERVRMSFPTNSMYSTLGVQPVLGRAPVASDQNNAVVISHALWTSWLGRDPDVLGRTLQVGGQPLTVIGVMPAGFRFPDDDTLLWISNTVEVAEITQPGQFGGNLVGRLAPGATHAQLAAELTQLARQLPERFGGSAAYARIIERHQAVVRPLEERLLGRVAQPLWVMLAATGIVLLIACANVANLFMVRTEGRARELALRRALGAGRAALVRLQMAEALVVAAAAAVLAVVLAFFIVPGFVAVVPEGVPRIDQVQAGAGTLVFALVAAALSALACGFAPALHGARPNLARLREGGRAMTGRQHLLRHGLVAAQTALALLLLIGSALLLRSAWTLQQTDLGYDTADLFTFQIAPEPAPGREDAFGFARFNLAFMERLRALPGVESVGLVENVPLNESTASMRLRSDDMAADPDAGALVNFTYSAGDYFQAMGISQLAGRAFTEADHTTTPGTVILSRSAAEQLWPGRDPIGRRLQRQGSTEWETVVGVVEDVMQDGPLQDTSPALAYFPMIDQSANGGNSITSPAYVLKTARADGIAPDVRALVREVAPEAPMYRIYTMEGLARDATAALSFTLVTIGIAALLALLLGAVGLYGVLSYVVAERTREIGLRMALGASARNVRRIVVARGIGVVLVGVGIGLLAALAATRALRSLLYGVEPFDPASFVTMALAMLAVGLLASYLPARRASRMAPLDALRAE